MEVVASMVRTGVDGCTVGAPSLSPQPNQRAAARAPDSRGADKIHRVVPGSDTEKRGTDVLAHQGA